MNAPDQLIRHTKTDALLKVIEGLGKDKNDRPIGIRTRALSEASGVPTNSIQALLTPHIESGRLVVCKITAPGQITQNEYRAGPGMPPPGFTPLKTKRAGITLGHPGKPLPVTTPAPEWPVLTPKAASTPATKAAIEPPVFLKPKKAAPAADASTVPTNPTPSPTRRQRQPINTLLRLAINQDGELQLGDDADPARWVFPPEQVLQLGDFLHETQGIWRP